uniref:Uncharacterized protein n=1 Tax=Parascaris univalens TaxID=6257 RepID=A0A915CHH6_PARUN
MLRGGGGAARGGAGRGGERQRDPIHFLLASKACVWSKGDGERGSGPESPDRAAAGIAWIVYVEGRFKDSAIKEKMGFLDPRLRPVFLRVSVFVNSVIDVAIGRIIKEGLKALRTVL